MPELVIKVGDGASLEDGDVIEAFTRRHIRSVHAQHIVRANAKLLMGDWLAATVVNGRTDHSNDALDAVWESIEAKTDHREANYQRWPAGTQDLKAHLFLAVDDLDDDTAATLKRPVKSGRVLTRKRDWKVSWRTALNLQAAQIAAIEDPQVLVDLRDSQFSRTAIVSKKLLG